MPTHYVLLGDVVASRDIDERGDFGATLTDACATVSDQHADAFLAPLEPLKGVDEVGGVLTDPAPLYDVLDGLRERLHPQELRVAVAAGGVDVGVGTGNVSRMDGPAFHRADELLSDLDASTLRVAFDFERAPLDATLADEVNLLFLLKRRWTDRQRDVVRAYRETESQDAVAENLGVSQPAVSQALSRASWPAVREIEERLRSTFEAV
ncbi:SatD family protein [Halobacterium zhouii]|uniref:SatD family protein n=1 Tax=Halobacterium zhouii TaxID=2902624 RepID=UPI001E28F178|nr:SatD family protein [Halobacterium zhouii]